MRSLRSLFAVAAAIGLAVALLPGCNGASVTDPWGERSGPKVLTSFAPLHCFALNVAGEDASVMSVMSETGPHNFDPTPRHAIAVRRADLFIINGLGIDDTIAKKLAKSSRNPNMKLIEAAIAIPVTELREGGCSCGHEHADDHAHHGHAHALKTYDPHVWLGIPQAIHMVERIRDSLKEIDPSHAAGYDERAKNYVAKLEKLRADGKELLAGKKERKLLAFHDSLYYFTKSFDLVLADAIESAPGAEPDPQSIINLIKKCREQGVRHIAIEPQYDANTSAKTILKALKEINGEYVTVDTLETAKSSDMDAGWYERKMRENLKNLAEKLQ